MKIATTDLEQLEQFRKLHIQLGATIKQIETLQTRITLAELLREQASLGASIGEPEDVDALQQQMIISMKSIRNRASHFITELMDISKRARKPSVNGKAEPPREPVKLEIVAPEPDVEPESIDDGEIILDV
jgi:hypothetical protein